MFLDTVVVKLLKGRYMSWLQELMAAALVNVSGSTGRRGVFQRRLPAALKIGASSDFIVCFFNDRGRVKQHRADLAGQEVRHRNSILHPINFQNKTPPADS